MPYQRVRDFFKTEEGKTISWLASNGINYIPVLGNIIGAGLSFYEKFLAKDVLPDKGALTFINNKLPSIYQQPREFNIEDLKEHHIEVVKKD